MATRQAKYPETPKINNRHKVLRDTAHKRGSKKDSKHRLSLSKHYQGSGTAGGQRLQSNLQEVKAGRSEFKASLVYTGPKKNTLLETSKYGCSLKKCCSAGEMA